MLKTMPTLTVMAGCLQIRPKTVACYLSNLATIHKDGNIHHFIRLGVVRRPTLQKLVGNLIQMSM